MPTHNSYLARRIKELRKSKKLTQGQLGEIFGSPKQTVWSWENGDAAPTLPLLIQLADYFEVSLDYLVGRSAIMDKDIEKLNSYYVSPETLFHALDCLLDEPSKFTAYPRQPTITAVLNNDLSPFQEGLDGYLKNMSKKRSRKDEKDAPIEVVSAKCSALIRFLHDIIDHSIPDQKFEARINTLWRCRDFIFAASFTPLRLYENGNGQPFFDPIEFMANLDLIRKTMGPALTELPWGTLWQTCSLGSK